jgi:hypothetical protein
MNDQSAESLDTDAGEDVLLPLSASTTMTSVRTSHVTFLPLRLLNQAYETMSWQKTVFLFICITLLFFYSYAPMVRIDTLGEFLSLGTFFLLAIFFLGFFGVFFAIHSVCQSLSGVASFRQTMSGFTLSVIPLLVSLLANQLLTPIFRSVRSSTCGDDVLLADWSACVTHFNSNISLVKEIILWPGSLLTIIGFVYVLYNYHQLRGGSLFSAAALSMVAVGIFCGALFLFVAMSAVA